MIVILRLLSILVRVYAYFNPICKYLSDIFIQNQLNSSFQNLKENIFLMQRFGDSDLTGTCFFSILMQKIGFFFIENEIFMVVFLGLIDIAIGKVLNNFLTYHRRQDVSKEDQNSSYSIELIYLFNPISILNASSLSLGTIYTIVLLLFFIYAYDSTVGSFLLALGLVFSPAYFFNYVFLTCFVVTNRARKLSYLLYFLKFGVAISLLLVLETFISSDYNILHHTQHYVNYYSIIDSLPNLNVLWYLQNQTFLRYQLISILLIICIQFLINSTVYVFMKNKTFEKSEQIVFLLLFSANHLMDRYPTANDFIVLMLLITVNYDILKSKYFNLSMICLFAGFILVYSRGNSYLRRSTGTVNYVYFQNVAYNGFIIFNHLINISSVKEYNKHYYRDTIARSIVNEILSAIGG